MVEVVLYGRGGYHEAGQGGGRAGVLAHQQVVGRGGGARHTYNRGATVIRDSQDTYPVGRILLFHLFGHVIRLF